MIVPAVLALTVIVVLSGLLLSRTGRPSTAAQPQPSPTPTWTLRPTQTATPTLVLTPPAPTPLPGTLPLFTSTRVHVSIRPVEGWAGHDETQSCPSCGGVIADFTGPTDANAFGVIELLTSSQWANASNDQAVNNADGWFLEQGGVTEQGRTTMQVGSATYRRGLFKANDGRFTAWLFGCHHANHEYMLYFFTDPSYWTTLSSGDISAMIASIQWL